MFVNKLSDADCEATETKVWFMFARDCSFLRTQDYLRLEESYSETGRMLGSMAYPEKFAPRR